MSPSNGIRENDVLKVEDDAFDLCLIGEQTSGNRLLRRASLSTVRRCIAIWCLNVDDHEEAVTCHFAASRTGWMLLRSRQLLRLRIMVVRDLKYILERREKVKGGEEWT